MFDALAARGPFPLELRLPLPGGRDSVSIFQPASARLLGDLLALKADAASVVPTWVACGKRSGVQPRGVLWVAQRGRPRSARRPEPGPSRASLRDVRPVSTNTAAIGVVV